MVTLETRVRQLEDHLAVMRLDQQLGPSGRHGKESAWLLNSWDEDGVLDSDLSRLEGPGRSVAMVESDGQRALIARGCAHVQSAPVITVDGDQAAATAYSQVFVHNQEGHEVWRVSANHWECRRTPGGWRLTRRLNRVIDGTADSSAVLVHALGPSSLKPAR